MTSWERGKENEQMGQREEREGTNRGDLGEQVGGAARDLGGKIEQGADNLRDTLTGRQRDLEGNERTNPAADAGREAQHLGKDVARSIRDATENA